MISYKIEDFPNRPRISFTKEFSFLDELTVLSQEYLSKIVKGMEEVHEDKREEFVFGGNELIIIYKKDKSEVQLSMEANTISSNDLYLVLQDWLAYVNAWQEKTGKNMPSLV